MKRAIAVLPFLMLIAGGCQTARIQPRPPIEVPQGLTIGHVQVAILAALANEAPTAGMASADDGEAARIEAAMSGALRNQRLSGDGWFPEGSAPGAIQAGFQRRNYKLHVRIIYTQFEVTVELLGSQNLKQSRSSIHHRAYVWIEELELRIRRSLGILSVLAQPAPTP